MFLAGERPYVSEISNSLILHCIHASRTLGAETQLADLFPQDPAYAILSSQWHANIAPRYISGINAGLVIREGTDSGNTYKTH